MQLFYPGVPETETYDTEPVSKTDAVCEIKTKALLNAVLFQKMKQNSTKGSFAFWKVKNWNCTDFCAHVSKNETRNPRIGGENIQNLNDDYVHNGEYSSPILTFFVEFDTIFI